MKTQYYTCGEHYPSHVLILESSKNIEKKIEKKNERKKDKHLLIAYSRDPQKKCNPYIFGWFFICIHSKCVLSYWVVDHLICPKERFIHKEQSKLRDASAAVADLYNPFIDKIAQNRQYCVKTVSYYIIILHLILT